MRMDGIVGGGWIRRKKEASLFWPGSDEIRQWA